MPKNDIGGFFVSLGLNADKNSFETGNKLVDNVANSFNKLIGAARNAAVVLAGTAIATGTVESAAYKTAEKIGISTETLDLWKASAKIAGVDANGLVSAMGKLSSVMGRMRIDGAGLDQFTKKLGELGLVVDKVDIAKMLEMAPDELMTDILRKAQEASAKVKKDIADANKTLAKSPKDSDAQKKLKDAQKESQRISVIVGDVLGEAGQDFFIELQRQGKTIDEFLSGAGRTVFTTAADNQKGANFAVEVNTLRTEIESMTKLLGDSIGGELTPYVKELNDWIQKNGPSIRKDIQEISKAIGKIVEKVAPGAAIAATAADAIVQTGAAAINDGAEAARQKAKEGLVSINAKSRGESVEDNKARRAKQEAEHKRIEELIAADPAPKHGWIPGTIRKYKSELTPETVNAINNYTKEFGTGWNFSGSINEMKDGIMRPDGTVTQVAPDDWVFAARNVGDLARAFIPQSFGQAMAAYEKEFGRGWNFSGSVNEIKDGIMRPDGTVTQVAPDDWVFAARNVGDLARAFIPQSFGQATASAPSEYIINQTFNISGGNDMPQVLREQAYKGTQDGLMQLIQQSSQRLQLMSGTR